ncbi:4Fe-4S dicluster domain-containing protein [Desulfotignum phosphitoxidans]|jgi:heterodisulfide reductase subunit C|uniref:Putative heterodisulfide reductase, C subunit n=1 Tax=Desulfotignum phosphitoxidans DSM 13687 TaxID=1286635 RepID=S0G5N3_9BACT|nr:4Fe-4S dicluster domain-containing protein [Desulfotignum phosphitoxidans]EMS81199.1 putative heterodisulfide reductase, C subunit [Desulfotignum phosphitoxidans DSM 13687]
MHLTDIREKLAARPDLTRHLAQVKEQMATCIQCGTCSGSCPNAGFMDMTPRRMWRAVLTDRVDMVFSSQTFMLCASCYVCTLRCPRGLPLTDAMAELKQVAFALDLDRFRRSTRFYRAFMDNIRQYGRVRETEMMARYFLAVKDPRVPMSYTGMGIKLMAKHKLHPHFPTLGPGRLGPLFERATQQQEQ